MENGNLSQHSAAKAVGISHSTLQAYLSSLQNKPNIVKPVGTPLNLPEENELTACLKCMARWGFPLTRTEIKIVVAKFVTENKQGETILYKHVQKYCHFKNGMPGDDWLSTFMLRHNLSSKKLSTLEKSRVIATSNPFLIFEFYDLLEKELTALNITDKPSRIFNLDERAMFIDPSRGKAVGEKGKKLARVTETPGRESVTLMACVSASGERHPPLIIFSGKKLQSTWSSPNVDKNLTLAISENGWMITEIFDCWFILFCKQVSKHPLLLIYDGHKTHTSWI
ncbi:hypothetical protein AVEN_162388-1 [Araneus ventricosus]|uniref:DDE-1 domain-containing protein n=1 Tax=Araneus ventricosus TaxID=182803 RepID=A0A4Y2GGB5_ARAVE|nr:hypothetical protein AVEN_162388-1 [Araneus ventricosus]